MIRGDLVYELVSLSPELLGWVTSHQQVRDTQGGVWRLFNLIMASQNWNKIKFVDSQGCQFCFLIVLMPLASWLLSALAKKNIHKNLSCLCFICPFCVTVRFLGFVHLFLFLALSFSCGLAIVDSGYVASLPASHLKLVPGVFYAHFSTNKKHLRCSSVFCLWIIIRTSETIYPVHTFIFGFYYKMFTWLNVQKNRCFLSYFTLLQHLSSPFDRHSSVLRTVSS